MKSLLTCIALTIITCNILFAQVAICYDHMFISLDGEGEAFIPPEVFDEGSYDYDSLSVSQSYFNCDDIGDLEVTLYAHNGSNVSECVVNVNVSDKLPPFIACVPDGSVVLPLIGGQAILAPDLLIQDIYENCTIANQLLSESIFDGSDPTPLVQLNVIDQSNNSAFCNVIIQIGGVDQSYLTCRGTVNFAVPAGESRIVELSDVLSYGPFPSWNLELVITDSDDVVVPNNELFGDDLGEQYTATVTDPVTGATCVSTITITAVSFNCVSDLVVELPIFGTSVELTVADFNDGSSTLDSMWLSQSIFTCADVGETTITLYGLIGSTVLECTTILTVEDNVPPVPICDSYVVLALDADGEATLSPTLVDDGSYDNCGIASYTLSQTEFDTSSNALETVELTVEDESGNTNSCWVEVHILGLGEANLACNSGLYISLPTSGSVVPDVDILIEYGPFYGWDLSYFLLDPDGDTIPNNEITTAHEFQTLTFVVTEHNSGVNCTGSVYVDGAAPTDCNAFFICDNKPWNTPLADCASGHTSEDFIEWPANLDISSCYYSPDYLEDYTTVGWRNARPQILGDCPFKAMNYSDIVFVYPDDELKVLRTWTVVDWLNLNRWHYTQILTVDLADCATPVYVRSVMDHAVEGVQIYESKFTDDVGEAEINSNKYNSLSPILSSTIREGVDLHDVLAIQEHISGMRSFNELQLIAADVNDDNTIDIRDVLDARKIANEVIDPTLSEPWSFIGTKGDPLLDIDKPIAAGDYYGSAVEIIGMKKGDVNGDATVFGEPTMHSALVPIELFVTDQLLQEGEQYSIDFSIDDLENIGGQQLELIIDLNRLSINSVTSPAFPGFSEANYKITADNILKILWVASEDIILDGGASGTRDLPIISLSVEAVQNSILSKNHRNLP